MAQPIPQSPIDSPQAWLGADMAASDDWLRSFTDDEIDELEHAARAAVATGKPLAALTREDFALPTLAAESGRWLQELEQGRGFLLLRGLPVERWGFELSQAAYMGLGLAMGGLGSQNAAGDILGHVRDTGANPDDPSVRLYKTNRAQSFHTDGADVIGLMCLRGAKHGGQSRIASSVSVFNHILQTRPDLVPRMFESFHYDRHEEQAEGEDPTFPLPIAYYDGKRLSLFYVGWFIRQAQRHASVPRLTSQDEELLALIDSTADELSLAMDFQPGDIQLLKNSTILHGRAAFEDWPEQERRRHLLRLWINPGAAYDGGGTVVKELPTKTGVKSDSELLAEAGNS